MNQVMIYYVLNQNNYTQEEMQTIQEGVFKYMAWNTIDIWDTMDTKLLQTIKKAMPAPHYNPAKGIPWLVKEWANIEQYLQIGEIKEAIIDETAMSMTTQEIQEIQELADLQRELEEISEKEDDVIITQYKKTSAKEKRGTTTSKKEVQFGDLPKRGKSNKKNPDNGKDKGKKAEEDQSTSGGDNPGDDSSSSSESSDGKESNSEEESEDNIRKVRQLSPSEIEWEKITGKKTLVKRANKMSKNTSLVKLPQPEMFDGTNKKWRNLTTFDQYTARMAEWLTYQKLDIQKEEALNRFSWICARPALSWYEEYCSRVTEKKRNYYAFILKLRKKVVPSTAGLDLWKEWEEYNYTKLMKEHGPNPPVNLHSLECLRYYQSCINPQGEKMINMHALKVKFVTTLLIHIKTPTKLLINYNMDYEKIV